MNRALFQASIHRDGASYPCITQPVELIVARHKVGLLNPDLHRRSNV